MGAEDDSRARDTVGAEDERGEAGLPYFCLTSSGLPREEAFERWRTFMAPMYEVGPATASAVLPFGSNISYQVDDLIAHRTVLSTQRTQRDRRRSEVGPDYHLFQFYRSGGFQGDIAGKAIAASAGTMSLIGRRHLVDGVIRRADTTGIIVPCTRLHGLPMEQHSLLFDPVRNRLLATQILSIYRSLPATRRVDAAAVADEFVAFLRRVLDPSEASDVLEGRELDGGLRALAQAIVRKNLSRPDLSPEVIAGQMQVSRATLYRLLEPEGGVMRFVLDERLRAVRDALADPMETRTLGRLAEMFAFGSLPHLSRSFRNRYGASPRAWRHQHQVTQRVGVKRSVQHVWNWLREPRGRQG